MAGLLQVQPRRRTLDDVREAALSARQSLTAAQATEERSYEALDRSRRERNPDTSSEQDAYREAYSNRCTAETELRGAEFDMRNFVLHAAGIERSWQSIALVNFDEAFDRIEIAFGNVSADVVRPTAEDYDGFYTLVRDEAGQWWRQRWRTPTD